MTKPAVVGAINQLWAATCDEAIGGEYIVPYTRIGRYREDITSESASELWTWCEAQEAKFK
jgi:hypothetical protein